MSEHDNGVVRRFEHPGKGRDRARPVPKGRQVEPVAKVEIERLLGDRSRQRDLLIEHLHLVQDTYGQISAPHLAALADEMGLAFAEVFETATFYAHFDVLKDGEADLPALTVRVCDSLTCAMFGAEPLLEALRAAARVPMPLPGATTAPDRAASPPTVPVPPRLAPSPTVTTELARLPFTAKRP